MPQTTIKVTNSTKLKRQLLQLPDDIRAGAKKAVKEAATAIKRDARRRVPVDTGRLKRAIRYRVDSDGLGAVIRAQTPYAHLVEYGTTSAPAQPFMGPAAALERARFPGRIGDDVRKALGL